MDIYHSGYLNSQKIHYSHDMDDYSYVIFVFEDRTIRMRGKAVVVREPYLEEYAAPMLEEVTVKDDIAYTFEGKDALGRYHEKIVYRYTYIPIDKEITGIELVNDTIEFAVPESGEIHFYHMRNHVVVRLGEKSILFSTLSSVSECIEIHEGTDMLEAEYGPNYWDFSDDAYQPFPDMKVMRSFEKL